MTEKVEQRYCIKFCVQNDFSRTQTFQMMKKAFSDECMGQTQMKEWFNCFKDGRTSANSDPRSSRPSTTKTPENIERVRLAIEEDRRLIVR